MLQSKTKTSSPIRVRFSRDVFNDVYIPHLKNNTGTQIGFGGSSSGKSAFYAQRLIMDILKGGRNYLVVRQVGNTLKDTIFNQVEKTIFAFGLDEEFTINQTRLVITGNNGYQAIFKGLDKPTKIQSITPKRGVITDILIEEATEISWDAYKSLTKRLRGKSGGVKKRVTFVFNPILKTSWIYKEFFSKINWAEDQTEYADDNLTIIKTTYKDNRFLEQDDIDRLENEEDEYYYSVYTLGNWGVLGDVIFKNWQVQDLTEMIPVFDNLRHGQDFGYSNDPAAYVKTHYDSKRDTIYVFDERYMLEASDDDLAGEIKPLLGTDYLWCDSEDPKTIAALKSRSMKARGVKKGAGSVNYGIKWLKSKKIIIHTACNQFRNEIEQYHWKKNKQTGEVLNVPAKGSDHGVDALRYAYEQDSLEKQQAGFVDVKGL